MLLVKMNICDNCPNKKLCKAGIVLGGVSLILSSYYLCKKIFSLKNKVKKSSQSNASPDLVLTDSQKPEVFSSEKVIVEKNDSGLSCSGSKSDLTLDSIELEL